MKTTWLRKGVSFVFSSSGLATAILLTAAFGHRPSPGHYNSTPTQRARVIEVLAQQCNTCGCLTKMMDYVQDKVAVPAYDSYVFGRCGVPPVEGVWGEKSAYDAAGNAYFYGYDGYGNYFTFPGPDETFAYSAYHGGNQGRDQFGYYFIQDCNSHRADAYGYGGGYNTWGYVNKPGYGYQLSPLTYAPYRRENTLANLSKFFLRVNKRDLCGADAKIGEAMKYLQARLEKTPANVYEMERYRQRQKANAAEAQH